MSRPGVPRYNILGVGISALTPEEAKDRVLDAAREGASLTVSALAVHAVMEAVADPAYRSRLNALDIAAPDGQPVRWALNALHATRLRQRVYGPALMREVCASAAREGLPVFLFGTTKPTLARLSERLAAAHPGLHIAGVQASRFRRVSEAEAATDGRTIAESGAKIVFCGLGCPRQEAWVHAMRPHIRAPLIGVGAAFALWAGDRDMAPVWMQERGLEWLYRLRQEPARLAGRYLVKGPAFLCAVALQKLGHRAPEISSAPVAPDYWG